MSKVITRRKFKIARPLSRDERNKADKIIVKRILSTHSEGNGGNKVSERKFYQVHRFLTNASDDDKESFIKGLSSDERVGYDNYCKRAAAAASSRSVLPTVVVVSPQSQSNNSSSIDSGSSQGEESFGDETYSNSGTITSSSSSSSSSSSIGSGSSSSSSSIMAGADLPLQNFRELESLGLGSLYRSMNCSNGGLGGNGSGGAIYGELTRGSMDLCQMI